MISTSVESSTIATIGWESEQLFVGFKNGTYYRYDSVPHPMYCQVIESPSAGKTLNALVKGTYPVVKLDQSPFI